MQLWQYTIHEPSFILGIVFGSSIAIVLALLIVVLIKLD